MHAPPGALHDRDGARREDAVKHGVQQVGQAAAHLGRGAGRER
jgi:hypothetical protein